MNGGFIENHKILVFLNKKIREGKEREKEKENEIREILGWVRDLTCAPRVL